MGFYRYLTAAAGGGVSLLDLGTAIDITDGTWTLYDPEDFIKSVAFSGGETTITFNAVAASATHLISSTNAVADMPRYYRALSIDSTAIDSDSLVTQLVEMTWDQTVRDFRAGFVIGLAIAPATTVRAHMLAQGAYSTLSTTGNPAFGCWGLTASSVTSTGYASIKANYSGLYGARSGGTQGAIAVDASGVFLHYAARTYTGTLTSSATVYEIVAVAPTSGSGVAGTIDDDDQMVFSATSSVIRQA